MNRTAKRNQDVENKKVNKILNSLNLKNCDDLRNVHKYYLNWLLTNGGFKFEEMLDLKAFKRRWPNYIFVTMSSRLGDAIISEYIAKKDIFTSDNYLNLKYGEGNFIALSLDALKVVLEDLKSNEKASDDYKLGLIKAAYENIDPAENANGKIEFVKWLDSADTNTQDTVFPKNIKTEIEKLKNNDTKTWSNVELFRVMIKLGINDYSEFKNVQEKNFKNITMNDFATIFNYKYLYGHYPSNIFSLLKNLKLDGKYEDKKINAIISDFIEEDTYPYAFHCEHFEYLPAGIALKFDLLKRILNEEKENKECQTSKIKPSIIRDAYKNFSTAEKVEFVMFTNEIQKYKVNFFTQEKLEIIDKEYGEKSQIYEIMVKLEITSFESFKGVGENKFETMTMNEFKIMLDVLSTSKNNLVCPEKVFSWINKLKNDLGNKCVKTPAEVINYFIFNYTKLFGFSSYELIDCPLDLKTLGKIFEQMSLEKCKNCTIKSEIFEQSWNKFDDNDKEEFIKLTESLMQKDANFFGHEQTRTIQILQNEKTIMEKLGITNYKDLDNVSEKKFTSLISYYGEANVEPKSVVEYMLWNKNFEYYPKDFLNWLQKFDINDNDISNFIVEYSQTFDYETYQALKTAKLTFDALKVMFQTEFDCYGGQSNITCEVIENSYNNFSDGDKLNFKKFLGKLEFKQRYEDDKCFLASEQLKIIINKDKLDKSISDKLDIKLTSDKTKIPENKVEKASLFLKELTPLEINAIDAEILKCLVSKDNIDTRLIFSLRRDFLNYLEPELLGELLELFNERAQEIKIAIEQRSGKEIKGGIGYGIDKRGFFEKPEKKFILDVAKRLEQIDENRLSSIKRKHVEPLFMTMLIFGESCVEKGENTRNPIPKFSKLVIKNILNNETYFNENKEKNINDFLNKIAKLNIDRDERYKNGERAVSHCYNNKYFMVYDAIIYDCFNEIDDKSSSLILDETLEKVINGSKWYRNKQIPDNLLKLILSRFDSGGLNTGENLSGFKESFNNMIKNTCKQYERYGYNGICNFLNEISSNFVKNIDIDSIKFIFIAMAWLAYGNKLHRFTYRTYGGDEAEVELNKQKASVFFDDTFKSKSKPFNLKPLPEKFKNELEKYYKLSYKLSKIKYLSATEATDNRSGCNMAKRYYYPKLMANLTNLTNRTNVNFDLFEEIDDSKKTF